MRRWMNRIATELTWLHFTRAAGLGLLFYEAIIDKADKPSVMVVVGAMILGTETLFQHKPKDKGQ